MGFGDENTSQLSFASHWRKCRTICDWGRINHWAKRLFSSPQGSYFWRMFPRERLPSFERVFVYFFSLTSIYFLFQTKNKLFIARWKFQDKKFELCEWWQRIVGLWTPDKIHLSQLYDCGRLKIHSRDIKNMRNVIPNWSRVITLWYLTQMIWGEKSAWTTSVKMAFIAH